MIKEQYCRKETSRYVTIFIRDPILQSSVFFIEIGHLAPAFFGGNVRDAGVEPPPAVGCLLPCRLTTGPLPSPRSSEFCHFFPACLSIFLFLPFGMMLLTGLGGFLLGAAAFPSVFLDCALITLLIVFGA
jgi:hypothetical protein